MSASDFHFTITLGGLGVTFTSVVVAAYRLGRILQGISSFMEHCTRFERRTERRLNRLERNGRRNDDS